MADKSPKPTSSNFPTLWYRWVQDDQYFRQPPQAPGFYQTMALRRLTVFTDEIIKHYVNSENVFPLLNTSGNVGIRYLFSSKRETESCLHFPIPSKWILSAVVQWLHKQFLSWLWSVGLIVPQHTVFCTSLMLEKYDTEDPASTTSVSIRTEFIW